MGKKNLQVMRKKLSEKLVKRRRTIIHERLFQIMRSAGVATLAPVVVEDQKNQWYSTKSRKKYREIQRLCEEAYSRDQGRQGLLQKTVASQLDFIVNTVQGN